MENRGWTIGRAAAAGITAAAAGWVAAQRHDRKAIEADPAKRALDADLGESYRYVRSADGTRIACREWGPADAPTLVLVHGWMCSTRFWTLQIQKLSEDHRVIAMDLRGHGESARPDSKDYSIEAFAADLNAVIAARCSETLPIVAGHSLGAMTLVAWAAAEGGFASERIAGAALINTGVGDLISESLVVEGVPAGLAQLERLAGETVLSLRAPIPTFTAPITNRVVRYVALSRDATPAAVAFTEQLILDCPADVRAACGGTLSRIDLAKGLRELDVPTLVVAGELDRLTPPAHAERMASELSNVQRHLVISRSGHMSPIEDSTAVNRALSDLATAVAAQPA